MTFIAANVAPKTNKNVTQDCNERYFFKSLHLK
jgi:hypothetical protein